jgi:hypothetical protein
MSSQNVQLRNRDAAASDAADIMPRSIVWYDPSQCSVDARADARTMTTCACGATLKRNEAEVKTECKYVCEYVCACMCKCAR